MSGKSAKGVDELVGIGADGVVAHNETLLVSDHSVRSK